jgi:hypothetical protein
MKALVLAGFSSLSENDFPLMPADMPDPVQGASDIQVRLADLKRSGQKPI